MDLHRCHFEQQLRRRELELVGLRRNLHELNTKFVQLQQAFEINLRTQKRREIEFNLIKMEKQDIRRFSEECLREKTQLRLKVVELTNERDHWKGVTAHQRKVIQRSKVNRANERENVKRECENILRMTRETAEKHFRELIALYNGAKEKTSLLQDEIDELKVQHKIFQSRTFELANLLKTLERFDVDIKLLCQLTAEAIQTLMQQEKPFEESIAKLRQVTWSTNEDNKERNSELVALKSQNEILKEIIKNLKRKTHSETKHKITETNEDEKYTKEDKSKETFENSNGSDNLKDVARNKITEITNLQRSDDYDSNNDERRIDGTLKHFSGQKLNSKSTVTDMNKKALHIESHLNGIFYEEYVIRFSNNREMKIKHSPELSANTEHLKLEFVDSEQIYEDGRPDKILILLNNVHASIKIEQTGINCATQTIKVKQIDSYTQTCLSGIRNYKRLNAGSMMLHSEKRAIEKSLSNLERVVTDLKSNALSHAQSMIGKGSKFLENDELFECIKLLDR